MSDREKCKKKNSHWPLKVFLISVALSAVLSFFSSTALAGAGIWIAALVLVIFIGLGILFDMVGVAVTAADPRPFHSMAAHKEKGGREAVRLLSKVSGSTAAVIVTQLQRGLNTTSVLISIAVTALISGATIGGKALGKKVAINDSTSVVYRVARVMHTLHLFR